jgi:pimeloyl-ACP methyl ester carboxylesterase
MSCDDQTLPNPLTPTISKEQRQFLFADQMWLWRGQSIGYIQSGVQSAVTEKIELIELNNHESAMPPLVLIHGFGASVGHWRKNIATLAKYRRVYALDLLGFGMSSKPDPALLGYTFETWGQQVADFIAEVVGEPAVLIGNSIGAVVAMQAAVMHPNWVTETVLINCSLRLLQEKKQLTLPWYRREGARLMQRLLGIKAVARLFFDQVRRPQTVRRILQQAYVNHSAVSDELVEMLLTPAQDPAAVDVFMAFVRYSQGPTPEDLLAVLPCRAQIIWGEADPWEPLRLGYELAAFPCVKSFITVPNAGHCPQDEAPEIVNQILVQQLNLADPLGRNSHKSTPSHPF